MPMFIITKLTRPPKTWWGSKDSYKPKHKSSVGDNTKFSYVKELVDLKVRKLIPFTVKGYVYAKSLLEGSMGKQVKLSEPMLER